MYITRDKTRSYLFFLNIQICKTKKYKVNTSWEKIYRKKI